MSHHLDGAQCDVVSVAVLKERQTDTQMGPIILPLPLTREVKIDQKCSLSWKWRSLPKILTNPGKLN